jgi:cholesterol oxidase
VRGRDHYDVLVIGSGFGGSVAALRLTEKGYRVGVVEAGRRFEDSEFASNTWDIRKYVFAPRWGCFGIQRLTTTKNITILTGAGVGGGSLVYGNTMYEAPDRFFGDGQWAHITDWKSELAPWYDQVRRMFGVTTYDRITDADVVLRQAAVDLGMPSSWTSTPVALVLGAEEGVEIPDPYFGGVGPTRRTCLHCGECLTGCRHNAKNSLTKNYLYLAELAGAEVLPLTTVTDVRPIARGYAVSTRRTGPVPRRRRVLTADQVVFAAAALGTQTLLHRMKANGNLDRISPRLGELTRTNSEAGVMIRARDDARDFSRGAAITCSLHVNGHTHAEPARYGRGSTTIALALTPLVDPVAGRSRLRQTLKEFWRRRHDLRRLLTPRGWPEQTLVIGVMQNLDNSLTTYLERRLFGRRLATRQGIGAPNPTHIPEANALARQIADQIDGIPAAGWNDALDRPMTGHFLGGCAIGDSPATGVVDPYHRLFGYSGLHVIDGSTVTANLGVNPSLTIAALAERAVSMWPNKGEADRRPELGEPYRRVPAEMPAHPVVPPGAPAELRLPAGVA